MYAKVGMPPGALGWGKSGRITTGGASADIRVFGASKRRWAIVIGASNVAGQITWNLGAEAAANFITGVSETWPGTGYGASKELSHYIYGSMIHNEFHLADNGVSQILTVVELVLTDMECPYCYG